MALATPATQSHGFRSQRPVSLRTSVAAPSILLVEDTNTSQAEHLQLLQRLSCNVDVAVTGQEAIERASRLYDLILLDTNLPDLCPFHVGKIIKQRHHLIHLPIVALVQQANKKHAHIDDLIMKPVTPEKLIAALTKWVH